MTPETPAPSLGRKVAVGAAFLVLGRLAIRLLSTISTIILARLLLPEDFGLIALAFAIFGIADAISSLGYAVILVRMKDPERSVYDTAWTLNLIRCVLLGLLLAGTAQWQADWLGDQRIGPLLWVIGLNVALDGLVSVGLIRLQREFRYNRFAVYQVVTRFSAFVFAILIAVIWQSYWCFVLGTLIAKLITIPFGYWLAPHWPRLSLRHWRHFMAFTKWGVVFNLAAIVEIQGPTLVIGRLLGLPTLGMFNIAQQIGSIPVTELAAPTRMPLYSGYAEKQNDISHVRYTYLQSQGFLLAIICPISVGIALVAPELEQIFLGDRWAGTDVIIAVLALVALFDNFSNSTFGILYLTDRFRQLALCYLGLSTARFAAATLGIWAGGMTGLLVSLVIAALLSLAFWQAYAARLLQASLSDLQAVTWRPVVAALVMSAGVLALRAALPSGTELGTAIARLLTLSMAGAVLHLGAQALLWRLSGAPPGAERRMLDMARAQLRARFPNFAF